MHQIPQNLGHLSFGGRYPLDVYTEHTKPERKLAAWFHVALFSPLSRSTLCLAFAAVHYVSHSKLCYGARSEHEHFF